MESELNRVKQVLPEIISCLFILLFGYAGISKLLDFEEFRVQLGQSPLLSAFADGVALGIPVIELVVAISLSLYPFRLTGLFASFSLMLMFTAYIIIILNFSDYIPCSCGGVLEELNWNQHLAFNAVFILLAVIGIVMQNDQLLKNKI